MIDSDVNFFHNLLLTKGFGLKTLLKIFKEFDYDLGETRDFIINNEKFRSKFSFNEEKLDKANIILEKCASRNVEILPIWDEKYPKNLKEISDPPIFLYSKGNTELLYDEKNLTIVGTRKPTEYGMKWTNHFASSLVDYGFSIVSGMAFGIDKIAHESAINSGGKTIAVLALNPDEASPRSNFDIYKKILVNDGLVISEFPPETKLRPGMFPLRNRIVAGLSLGTLVIEAGEKSGSLITADLAFNYNRNVYAVPGRIEDKNSSGTNYLIKSNKGKLVNKVDDILEDFDIEKSELDSTKLDLSSQERYVFDILKSSSGLFQDEIDAKLEQNLTSVCTILEVKGIIKKLKSGKFVLSK